MTPSIPHELRWLLREVKPFLRWHVASFVCVAAASILALLSPLVLKWLIDTVLPTRRTFLLMAAVGVIFVCQQGRAVLTSASNYLTMMTAQGIGLALRLKLLRHLDTLSPEFHEATAVGTSMYPLKEPVEEISYFGTDLVPSLLRTLMASILTLGAMVALNARTTLVVLPMVPVFLFARRRYRTRLEHESQTVQRQQSTWNNFLQEHLSSIVALQLLRREGRQERTGFRLLAKKVKSVDRLFQTGVHFKLYTSLVVSAAMSCVVGLGGWSVITGSMTVGTLVAFYTYLAQLFEPLSGIAETYVRAQKMFGSIRQVLSIMELEPTVRNHPFATAFPATNSWTIAFDKVVFDYPGGRGLLSIPSLCIRSGEILAVVGKNGAGKSTLGKLLVRLYDVNEGSIVIAGEDIRRIRLDGLRKHVAYAPCQPVLFNTTVAANLRAGSLTASDAELSEALSCAGLSAWFAALPGGLRATIGPGGSRLSSGQKQRLGIARLILQRPHVLILDEATSSLDALSEQELLQRLRSILPRTTILLVSHRWSSLSAVERVILLDAGRVIRDGDPAALLRKPDLLSHLFSSPLRSGIEEDSTPVAPQ